MIPRIAASKLVSTAILAILAVSIVAMLDGGFTASWLGLAPERIWHGQLWRLVTWVVLQPAPWGLVVTCLAIYKFGGELAPRWGERRLRRFALHVVLAGGVVATLGALVSDSAWLVCRGGGWAITDALVIAWARQYPVAVLRLYGLVELSGPRLVWATVAITSLYALACGPATVGPELVACFGAALYPRKWLV